MELCQILTVASVVLLELFKLLRHLGDLVLRAHGTELLYVVVIVALDGKLHPAVLTDLVGCRF